MAPPKIAIPFDYDPFSGYLLNANYVRAIQSHGGRVIPLIYDKSRINQVLDEADGVLIPGGLGDIDTKLYGQDKKHKRVKIVKDRCDFEFALLENVIKLEKPLLGICWGLQIVNVFFGGSLVQHIPADRPSSIIHENPRPGIASHHWIHFEEHERPNPDDEAKHLVVFEENGEGVKLFGHKKVTVNSTHHQCIDDLASGLTVEAMAEDGIIECVRMNNYPFGWGVQWHPERHKGDVVIPRFLDACIRLRS